MLIDIVILRPIVLLSNSNTNSNSNSNSNSNTNNLESSAYQSY